jgi:hypothetical protein
MFVVHPTLFFQRHVHVQLLITICQHPYIMIFERTHLDSKLYKDPFLRAHILHVPRLGPTTANEAKHLIAKASEKIQEKFRLHL